MPGAWFKSPRWNDARFPASGLNPAGSAKPPSIDTDDGSLIFSGNFENSIGAIFQLDHGAVFDTIRPHVHFMKETASSDEPAFSLEYKYCPIFGIASEWVTLFDNSYSPVINSAEADFHDIQGLGHIDISGARVSDIWLFKFTRHGNTDNYSGNVKLLEFDVHVQVESTGTIAEF